MLPSTFRGHLWLSSWPACAMPRSSECRTKQAAAVLLDRSVLRFCVIELLARSLPYDLTICDVPFKFDVQLASRLTPFQNGPGPEVQEHLSPTMCGISTQFCFRACFVIATCCGFLHAAAPRHTCLVSSAQSVHRCGVLLRRKHGCASDRGRPWALGASLTVHSGLGYNGGQR